MSVTNPNRSPSSGESPPRDPHSRPLLPSRARDVAVARKPNWIRIRPPSGENYQKIKGLLKERNLHTVCEEARCPNLSECWAGGTATFMIGGEICTRACRFCAVKTARRPPPLDPKEPAHVAQSIVDLKLKYVVLTTVDRDDLDDGSSRHMADTVRQIKQRSSEILVEALVGDYKGDLLGVHTVVDSGLDVYAHNIETVRRLQYRVRDPRAGYDQSLRTLIGAKLYAREKKTPLYTKSSIMLGLGETEMELREAFADLREAAVDVLTLGQYLRPSKDHLPVEKFYSPQEFDRLKAIAESFGFMYVASGPMVRSSYRAAEFFMEGMIRSQQKEGCSDGI